MSFYPQNPGSSGGGITPPAGDIGGTTSSPTVVATHLSAPLPLTQGGTGLDETSNAALLTALGAAASPVSGQFLCAPTVYAPVSQTTLSVAGTTFAAFSAGVVCTGPFTAPPSGSVKVTVSCVGEMLSALTSFAVALAATGTVTPLVSEGYPQATTFSVGIVSAFFWELIVTGLTPGDSYNFDVLGATGSSGDAFEMQAWALTGNPITAANRGAPVVVCTHAI